jgi:Cu2+-containing amine oxidase
MNIKLKDIMPPSAVTTVAEQGMVISVPATIENFDYIIARLKELKAKAEARK